MIFVLSSEDYREVRKMLRKRDDVVVAQIFEKEINQIKQDLKNELVSEFGDAIQNLSKAIQYLDQELKTIKNTLLASQEIAIRSAVQGVTEVNLLGIVNQLEQEILKFLREELKYPDLKTINNMISLAVSNAIGQLIQQETELLTKYSKEIKEIKDVVIAVRQKLQELSSLKEKLDNLTVNIDLDEFEDRIKALENKISELESRVDYIYQVNKKLEELIRQKEQESEEVGGEEE
jgi:uncharacterized protein YukE